MPCAGSVLCRWGVSLSSSESISLDLPLEAIGINCAAPGAISTAVRILANIVEKSEIKVCAYGNCFWTTTSDWMDSLYKDLEEGNNNSATTEITHTKYCALKDYYDAGYLLSDSYARYAREWASAGATIIGGCCGIRPIHMHQVFVNALTHHQQSWYCTLFLV